MKGILYTVYIYIYIADQIDVYKHDLNMFHVQLGLGRYPWTNMFQAVGTTKCRMFFLSNILRCRKQLRFETLKVPVESEPQLVVV